MPLNLQGPSDIFQLNSKDGKCSQHLACRRSVYLFLWWIQFQLLLVYFVIATYKIWFPSIFFQKVTPDKNSSKPDENITGNVRSLMPRDWYSSYGMRNRFSAVMNQNYSTTRLICTGRIWTPHNSRDKAPKMVFNIHGFPSPQCKKTCTLRNSAKQNEISFCLWPQA